MLTKEIKEMPYQDFVAKLMKSGEVMDKEISEQEEELLHKAFYIVDACVDIPLCFMSISRGPTRLKSLEFKHMAIGLAGEAGELLDAIKKLVIYRMEPGLLTDNKSIYYNVLEEIGDIMFFHTGHNSLCSETGWNDVDETVIEAIEEFLVDWNAIYPDSSLSIEMAIDNNKRKLFKRYSSLSYSDKQAHDRADKQ
jgi:NTP pyrophosphatase (non-canonical NTP hydrolase)